MFNHSTILGAIMGFALLAPSVAIAVPSADNSAHALEARVWRSDIDIETACHEQYSNDWVALKTGDDCGGWTCEDNGQRKGLNLDLYCIRRFGSDAYAMCNGGVYSWACHDRT